MSNVVKSERAESYRSAAVFSLADIEAQAAEIVAAAGARRDAILAAASDEADEIKKRAADEGRQAGLKDGREQGRQDGLSEGRRDAFAAARDEIASLTQALVAACDELGRAKDTLFKQAQVDLLRLSLLVAGKIVAREIDADKHVTADNVARCLALLSERKNLLVRIPASSVELINEYLPELARRFGDLSSVKIVPDDTVSPGGCLLTSESGVIDATIESQFGEVERILFGDPNG